MSLKLHNNGIQTIFDALGEQFLSDMRNEGDHQWLRANNGRVNELIQHHVREKQLTSYTEGINLGATYYRYGMVKAKPELYLTFPPMPFSI